MAAAAAIRGPPPGRQDPDRAQHARLRSRPAGKRARPQADRCGRGPLQPRSRRGAGHRGRAMGVSGRGKNEVPRARAAGGHRRVRRSTTTAACTSDSRLSGRGGRFFYRDPDARGKTADRMGDPSARIRPGLRDAPPPRAGPFSSPRTGSRRRTTGFVEDFLREHAVVLTQARKGRDPGRRLFLLVAARQLRVARRVRPSVRPVRSRLCDLCPKAPTLRRPVRAPGTACARSDRRRTRLDRGRLTNRRHTPVAHRLHCAREWAPFRPHRFAWAAPGGSTGTGGEISIRESSPPAGGSSTTPPASTPLRSTTPSTACPRRRPSRRGSERAPPGFLFAIKASRFLTHMKKLKDPEEPLDRLLSRARRLGKKLGPVLYQLPPRWPLNLSRLEGFLDALPRTGTHVIEFREPSWYAPRVFRLLERRATALCLHDMPGSASPREAVGPLVYVRFHGSGSRYGGAYPEQRLEEWAGWLAREIRGGRPAFVLFQQRRGGQRPA